MYYPPYLQRMQKKINLKLRKSFKKEIIKEADFKKPYHFYPSNHFYPFGLLPRLDAYDGKTPFHSLSFYR